MKMRQLFSPVHLLLLLVSLAGVTPPVQALEPHECIELDVGGPHGARFHNKCNEMINMMYCVEHPDSPKTCAAERMMVTTLVPLAEEVVPGYSESGQATIYTAICAYPTAPVGWQPGRGNDYECKKTCVMC